MPRYTKQQDKYHCGPTAILNALKWAGVSASYKEHIKRLSGLAEYGPPTGVKHRAFDRALRTVGRDIYSVRKTSHPTLSDIVFHLQNEGAIVFNYYWENKKGNKSARHHELLVGISPSGKSIYTVNRFRRGSAFRRVSREAIKKDNKRSHDCRAWFLTKV